MKAIAIALIITAAPASATVFGDLRQMGGVSLEEAPAASPVPAPAAAPDPEALRFNHNESRRCVKGNDPFAVPAYIFATPSPAQLPGDPQTITVFGGSGTGYPSEEGRCVSQKKYRPALRLSAAQRAGYGLAGTADPVYANVFHLGRFYVAAIPADSVKELYFLVAYYRMPLIGARPGHAQVRAIFSRPARLLPQFPAGQGEALETDSLIFSVQSVATEDDSLSNPIRYVDGSALLAMGVYTVQSGLYNQFVVFPGAETRQYRLRLDAGKREAYVQEYLRQSDMRRLSTYFRGFSINCNSSQLGVLDRVVRGDYTADQLEDMEGLNVFDPAAALAALAARGLTSEEERLVNFEKEPESVEFLAGYRP